MQVMLKLEGLPMEIHNLSISPHQFNSLEHLKAHSMYVYVSYMYRMTYMYEQFTMMLLQ